MGEISQEWVDGVEDEGGEVLYPFRPPPKPLGERIGVAGRD